MAKPVFTTALLMVTAVEIVTVALFAGNVPPVQGSPEVVVFQSPVPAEVWAKTLDDVKNKNAKSNKAVLNTFLAVKPFDDKLFILLLFVFEKTVFISSVY